MALVFPVGTSQVAVDSPSSVKGCALYCNDGTERGMSLYDWRSIMVIENYWSAGVWSTLLECPTLVMLQELRASLPSTRMPPAIMRSHHQILLSSNFDKFAQTLSFGCVRCIAGCECCRPKSSARRHIQIITPALDRRLHPLDFLLDRRLHPLDFPFMSVSKRNPFPRRRNHNRILNLNRIISSSSTSNFIPRRRNRHLRIMDIALCIAELPWILPMIRRPKQHPHPEVHARITNDTILFTMRINLLAVSIWTHSYGSDLCSKNSRWSRLFRNDLCLSRMVAATRVVVGCLVRTSVGCHWHSGGAQKSLPVFPVTMLRTMPTTVLRRKQRQRQTVQKY